MRRHNRQVGVDQQRSQRVKAPRDFLRRMKLSLLVGAVLGSFVGDAWGQLVISGNENKIDLTSGAPAVVQNAEPDTLSLFDFSQFPPKVEHLYDIPNTVIGPPSNIAVAPDGSLALIANSLKIDPQDPTRFVPESFVHVLDLQARDRRPKRVAVGSQPSGISFTPDGRLALVANRAAGTISVLRVNGNEVEAVQTVEVASSEANLSDVAVHPDGRLALASVQEGSYLAVLEIHGDRVQLAERKISVYGRPYRVVISPDGGVALTAGQGAGSPLDRDALTVVDLASRPARAVDYVTVGSGPESLEISPDGRLIAVVLMANSNLAPDHPQRTDSGELVLLTRRGTKVELKQRLKIGRIPEGVAFTSNGDYLLVQCHPDRNVWVFETKGRRLRDTRLRIEVPGMPSSLRAAP